jgi:hypothetical protein
MVTEHYTNPPAFLKVLQEYLESNNWEVNWAPGSGPDFTDFRNTQRTLFIRYRWDTGEISASGAPTLRVFRPNCLEDVIFWIEGSKPEIIAVPNPYCDYGQVIGAEKEDEFGVWCPKPGTKNVRVHSNVFLCDEHMDEYQKKGFPYFESLSDEVFEEEEEMETCPNCEECLDECTCCNNCGSSSCGLCNNCDNSECACVCCSQCENHPCTCETYPEEEEVEEPAFV